MVSSFAASAFVGDAVLSVAFLGVSSAGSGGPVVGQAGPGRSEEAVVVAQVDPFVRAVGTEAIAGEVGLGSPGPEEALARWEVVRMVAERVGMVEGYHFPGAVHHAATAESHFVHACLEAAPMHVAECVDLADRSPREQLEPGPGPGPVAPAGAASRITVVGVGNFAVGHAAFVAVDAPYSQAAFRDSLALRPFERH